MQETLAKKYPYLLNEWDCEENKIDPFKTSYKSSTKVNWICKRCGYHYSAIIRNRTINKSGCPRCAGKVIWIGHNDLASQASEIAKELDVEKTGRTAKEIFVSQNSKVWWICPNGHSYEMTPNWRTYKSGGCPYCSNQRLLVGYNDLASQYPEIAQEWDYENNILLPTDVLYGTPQKVWWKCKKCKQEYNASVKSRTKNRTGCPYCCGLKPIVGINDFASTSPDLLKEWDWERNAVNPYTLSKNTHKKVWWKCPICQQNYCASINHRQNMSGCPYCKMSSGEQLVATTLNEFHIRYKPQGWFQDCRDKKPLKFDFLIYDNNGEWIGAIEYNGKQHYEPIAFYAEQKPMVKQLYEMQRRHEMIKIEYCISRSKPFLIIPYQTAESLSPRDKVIRFLKNLDLINES